VHQNEFQALRTRMGSMQNAVKQIDAIVQQGQEHQAALANAQQSAQTTEQIKVQQAQAEIQIERAMAASKIHNQQLKTMSQIQTAQQKAARPVNPRQALMQEVAQSNALTSPIQPAPGAAAGGLNGSGGAGYEQLPLE
jgi:Trk K+ transport system NAD-binding subunit